jgi:2,3,4,5-tetrahydropyridine-2-carboxylate N-succinyltransferase
VTSAEKTAWGFGLTTYAADAAPDSGAVLDVWFPSPALGERPANATAAPELKALEGTDALRRVEKRVELVEIDLEAAPPSTQDVWLRLHLLSHRLVRPHGQSLDGIFGLLTNVVWTSEGPCPVEGFELTRARLRAAGRTVAVYGVDKFPRMTDYVLPTGVRIADADRVRLGAHLAVGTTVMLEGHEGDDAGRQHPQGAGALRRLARPLPPQQHDRRGRGRPVARRRHRPQRGAPRELSRGVRVPIRSPALAARPVMRRLDRR